MDSNLIGDYVALYDKIKDTERALDEAKAQYREKEQEVLAALADSGLNSVKTADNRTVFLHRQLWAKAKPEMKDAAVDALVDSGLGDFVTRNFNTQTLSSWVREQDQLGLTLPEGLAATLDVAEVFSARVRKS